MKRLTLAVILAAAALPAVAQQAAPLSKHADVAPVQLAARASIAASRACLTALAKQPKGDPDECEQAATAHSAMVDAYAVMGKKATVRNTKLLDEIKRSGVEAELDRAGDWILRATMARSDSRRLP